MLTKGVKCYLYTHRRTMRNNYGSADERALHCFSLERTQVSKRHIRFLFYLKNVLFFTFLAQDSVLGSNFISLSNFYLLSGTHILSNSHENDRKHFQSVADFFYTFSLIWFILFSNSFYKHNRAPVLIIKSFYGTNRTKLCPNETTKLFHYCVSYKSCTARILCCLH